MARGRPAHHGVLVIDKPDGPTSHDVVAWVRRGLGERRVGHCGTLDPPATGVVVVAVGEATKLVAWLTDDDKVYEATIQLGTSTTTGDREGTVIDERAAGPDDVLRAVTEVAALVGSHELAPPVVSAVRIDGVRAHALARAGETVVMPLRTMTVREAVMLGHDLETMSLHVRLVVSKGTYIRTLAEHLGARIAMPAHLGALRRVAAGRFDLAACARVGSLMSEHTGARPDGKPRVRMRLASGLVDAALREHLEAAMLPIEEAAPLDWRRMTLDDPVTFERLRQGQKLALDDRDIPMGTALVRGPIGTRSLVVARIEPTPPPPPVAEAASDPPAPAQTPLPPPSDAAPVALRPRLRPVRVLDPDGVASA